MEYDDFELEIGEGDADGYPVRILGSSAGEARATMRFPFDGLALENQLQKVEIELLRSQSQRRREPSPQERSTEEFGARLYQALFRGDIRLRWEMSRELARQHGRGLRLKLRIEAPELASVPWEFLYDVSRGEFLSLSSGSPLARYLNLQHPRTTLSVQQPLRILGVVCSPNDLVRLDIEAERRRVHDALKDVIDAGLVVVEWLGGQGWRDLQEAMATGEWHVVHFVGHGRFDPGRDEGAIAMVGRNGRTRAINATRLARILADHRSLRLVVLNACEGAKGSSRDVFSSASSILVRRGIPAVVAMQYEISDPSAIEFAETFYTYLGKGFAVDRAVTEARKAMSFVAEGPEWGTIVLFMHTTDGRIFDMDSSVPGQEDVNEGRPTEQEGVDEAGPDGDGTPEPSWSADVAPGAGIEDAEVSADDLATEPEVERSTGTRESVEPALAEDVSVGENERADPGHADPSASALVRRFDIQFKVATCAGHLGGRPHRGDSHSGGVGLARSA